MILPLLDEIEATKLRSWLRNAYWYKLHSSLLLNCYWYWYAVPPPLDRAVITCTGPRYYYAS